MLNKSDFKYRYSTGRKDEPIDFFENALRSSDSLDLGLGYFSSACFNVLSSGFAHFISNGGIMRLYINQFLTIDDYALFKSDVTFDCEEYIIQSYITLKKTLSIRDEHFFRCLSYLIKNKRIEIKIVVPINGGLAHEKFGIFKDECNDKVSFTGSMNMTASALLRNIETVECTCSWKSEENLERITQSEDEFSEIWNGESDLVRIYSADHFCKEILQSYPDIELNELLVQEQEIIKILAQGRNKKKIESGSSDGDRSFPIFPGKYPNGPRPEQIEAYQKWVENGKQGIFAMATGTGKTVTSLNCALQEYLKASNETEHSNYHILILVPTIALVDQWREEVILFNFKNIITVFSQNNNWRKDLVTLKNKLRKGGKVDFVIISTYQSFANDDFQTILTQLPDSILLIADEAHNIGSESVRNIFRNLKIKKRIALSATPNRIYDDEGTAEIEMFFNDKSPYTYNFSMKRAIDEGRLMEYCYYPKIVYLDEPEMEKYAEYTIKLMNLFDSKSGLFKNEHLAKMYTMLRKQIIHKANDKIRVLIDIVNEIGMDRLKYCFIYVPEGKENRDEDENYLNDEDSEMLIRKMLSKLKEYSQNTTFNIYSGNVNKSDRKAILKGFENGDINVLLAMKCLDEGIDIPRAEIGIFASSTGNPRQFIQRRGRLLRKHPDKTFTYIYDMVVIPNFQSNFYSKSFFQMEKSLVRSELSRVAYFASLATNTHTAIQNLEEIAGYYQLSLPELILSINQ